MNTLFRVNYKNIKGEIRDYELIVDYSGFIISSTNKKWNKIYKSMPIEMFVRRMFNGVNAFTINMVKNFEK